MIPRRYEPVAFAFVLSAVMSLAVSGISTLVAGGAARVWMTAWLTAWALAFPLVMLAAPLARRVVGRLLSPQ